MLETTNLKGTYRPWEQVQAGTRDYLTLNWPYTAHNSPKEIPRYIFYCYHFLIKKKKFSSLLLI